MTPAYSSKDRFDALRKALQTLTVKKVAMIELTDERAVFLISDLSEEDVKTLTTLFAGWIGRTPVARLHDDKLILNY